MAVESVTGLVTGDAFGMALRQCWDAGAKAGVAYQVVERDDGYVDVTDAAAYLSLPKDWSVLDRAACDRARGRVLDVGCGAGRHAVVLQARGLQVSGLEPSPAAAAVCRERGLAVVEASIEAPPATLGRFDTLLLLGNNVGLLGGADTAPLALVNLARLAAPGARVLVAGTDPYATTDPMHLEYHEWNRSRGRMPGQLRIRVRYRRTITPWFDYWLPSVPELSDVLAGSPWRLESVDTDQGAGYLATLVLR